MAVNRFMKPADQPLLNTYVKLPFQEMSLAYNQVQKEHDAGEKLNNSLDDEILKVRASTPQHSAVLGQIRQGLDTQLSDLYDKHGGRYADMVPELSQIKNSLDKDLIINKKADDIYLVDDMQTDDMQTDDFTMDVDRMLK